MIQSSCEQLKIDTKDMCLLCLGPTVTTNCLDSDSSSTLPSLQGLKHLLRYLKVSPKELFNCSTEFLQSMEIKEDIDLKINLCSKCLSVTQKFNKLYQEYELIHLQLGSCVQSLYQSISEGNESLERVKKYKEQMRPTKSSDLVNASIAANFRNQTFKKCFLKLQSPTPRVNVVVQNVENYTKLAEAGYFDSSSTSTDCKTKSLQKAVKSQFHPTEERLEFEQNYVCIDGIDNRTGTESDFPKIRSCFTLGPQSFLQTSADPSSDTEVVAEVKSLKTNLSRKKGYFNYIRKLKTKPQPTAASRKSTFTSNNARQQFHAIKTCEHCNSRFSYQASLTTHISIVHSEHLISKFLPSHVSLQQCKQGVHAVWEQMFQISINDCQFCTLNLASRDKLKRHLICNHSEQFASKVYENIQSFPERSNIDGTEQLTPKRIRIPALIRNYIFSCEYCDSKFTKRNSLYQHKGYKHPEHIIYKFYPPHIPLDSCRKGLNFVFEQIFKKKSTSGFKCNFCVKRILQKESFKCHVVYKHGKRFALEAQHRLGILSQHLEVESADALANSRNHEDTSNFNTSEDNFDISPSSTLQETDFESEERSVIKLEIPQQEILGLDLDPLDEDYSE